MSEQPLEDKLARLVGAFDQYGELLKRVADLIGTYDKALEEAGIIDPLARAELLKPVQAKFLGGHPE